MVLRPTSYFTYVHPPHPLGVQAFPGVLRYVTADDIPAGGQNNALSTEFYKPEEVLGWGCLTCVCYVYICMLCFIVTAVRSGKYMEGGRIGNV